MNILITINKFLSDNGYLDDDNVEGIIFYGSYQTKTNNKSSDVDLLIIYRDDSDKEAIKGYKVYNGIEFEYFERTLKNLYDRAEYDYKNFEDTLYSSIGFGKILLDKNKNLEKLKIYILKKFGNGLPKLGINDKLYYFKSISKSMEKLNKMYKTNNPYFKIYYSLVLDKIRIYYNQVNGFSNISSSKIYKLYTDKQMEKVQHKVMPDVDFINLYLKCINLISIDNINKLYKYVLKSTKVENIDFENIRLKLEDRNH